MQFNNLTLNLQHKSVYKMKVYWYSLKKLYFISKKLFEGNWTHLNQEGFFSFLAGGEYRACNLCGGVYFMTYTEFTYGLLAELASFV